MNDGTIVKRLGVGGLDGEGQRITLHGVLEATELLEGIPPVGVEYGEVRLQGERPVVAL